VVFLFLFIGPSCCHGVFLGEPPKWRPSLSRFPFRFAVHTSFALPGRLTSPPVILSLLLPVPRKTTDYALSVSPPTRCPFFTRYNQPPRVFRHDFEAPLRVQTPVSRFLTGSSLSLGLVSRFTLFRAVPNVCPNTPPSIHHEQYTASHCPANSPSSDIEGASFLP